MSIKITDEYLVKAINSSKINKKPLVVYLSKDNSLEWLNSWVNEDIIDLINNRKACILLKIDINDLNSHYHFFKTYFKNLSNYEDGDYEDIFASKDNVLVIIHNNEFQYAINDEMDNHEKNELLQAFISDFSVEPKINSKSENKDQSEKLDSQKVYKNEYLKAKNEERLERQRLRKLIELDRLEKRERSINNKLSFNANENEVIIEQLKDNIKSKDTNNDCKLSIKTPENKNIIHTFTKEETLDDVRKYLMEEEGIYREFFFHRNIPRLTYKDMDEFKSLEELDLLPRSVLLIEYKSEEHQQKLKYFDAKTYNPTGLLGFLRNWWNGDASLQHEENEEEINEDDKKENRETYNGNTTNVLDPQKKHMD